MFDMLPAWSIVQGFMDEFFSAPIINQAVAAIIALVVGRIALGMILGAIGR